MKGQEEVTSPLVEPKMDEQEDTNTQLVVGKMTKRQVYKNLLTICFGFVLLFTAYMSLEGLQTSINADEGLGTVCLSVLYASMLLSSMFLPSLLISILGCKWTMAGCMMCYVLYMCANLYAVWGVMVPASILIGLAAAPLWSAQSSYITRIAAQYADVTGKTKDTVLNLFFNIFFFLFTTAMIWGNLISSTVLSEKPHNISEEEVEKCGATFCPTAYLNITNLERPPNDQITMMVGIYIGIGCLAILLISVMLDNTDFSDSEKSSKQMSRISADRLVDTFRYLVKYPELRLIVPMTIFFGLNVSFTSGTYTESYISCALGISNVGYSLITCGVAYICGSLIFGNIVKWTGRVPLFIFSGLLFISFYILVLLWQPVPSQKAIAFLIFAINGFASSIWQVQLNALYGSMFTSDPEPGFANYQLWHSVGFSASYGYGNVLCTDIKIYICLAMVSVSILGYLSAEVYMRRKRTSLTTTTKYEQL